MRPGRLRKRVIIQEADRTGRGSSGEATTSWSNGPTVWAAVEPLRGKEYLEGQQVQGEVTHKVTIRYRSGITPTDRISYDGRTLQIVSLINVCEKNIALELMCREVLTA